MELLLNEKNEIIAYAISGGFTNGTTFEGEIPDNFYQDFKAYFFKLQNDGIVENPDYVEPKPPVIGPSDMQQMIMQQASTMAQMQKIIMQQSKDIAELKGVQA